MSTNTPTITNVTAVSANTTSNTNSTTINNNNNNNNINNNNTITTNNNNSTNTNTTIAPQPITVNTTLNGNGTNVTTTTTPTTNITIIISSTPSMTPPTTTSMQTTTTTTTTLALSTTTAANTFLGLSMSNTLMITVFTGCTALILLVLCVICCRLLCIRTKRQPISGDRVKQQAVRQQSSNHYADPRVTENHYHSNDVTKLYTGPDLTYSRPATYSTFINPSFYEDVYARWKMQEQARFEKTYESPSQYGRQLRDQMDTPGFRWSTNSIRAVDNYDYGTYGRIPRGKVTGADSEKDADDTTSNFTTF